LPPVEVYSFLPPLSEVTDDGSPAFYSFTQGAQLLFRIMKGSQYA
jgi:hypothetical protein